MAVDTLPLMVNPIAPFPAFPLADWGVGVGEPAGVEAKFVTTEPELV
jgi:hypothetical protein